MRAALSLALLLSAVALPALAGPVEVRIENVGPKGMLFVQMCAEAELGHGCAHRAKIAPHPGETSVRFDVPAGRYQVSAIQDVDGNGRLSFGMMGRPSEPWGYSRDAKAVMGPPSFADAAVAVGAAPIVIPIHLKM